MAKQKYRVNLMVEKLNIILSNAELVPDTCPLREKLRGTMHLNSEGSYTVFYIQDADRPLYIETLKELYALNKEVQSSYTFKTIEKLIENTLYDAKTQGDVITDKTINDIFKKLLDVEKIEYEIVHTISGVIFIQKVDFDNFFFSNYEEIRDYTTATYMNGNPSGLDNVAFDEIKKAMHLSVLK